MDAARRPRPRPKPQVPAADLRARTEFEGSFLRYTYQSGDNTFSVVPFVSDDGAQFKAAGNLYGAAPGENLRIKGGWREHSTYGWTFQIESFVQIAPPTGNALLSYLGSGLIKGVGQATAKRIVERFGEQTIDVLDNHPELLREVPKISNKMIHRIIESWQQHRQERETMLQLKEIGLSNALSKRLIQHYGEGAAAIMKKNPYRAGLEVSYIGFRIADQIAAKVGIEPTSPYRITAAFVHALDEATTDGHTYLDREQLLEKTVDLLRIDRPLVEEQLDEALRLRLIHRCDVGDKPECYFVPVILKTEQDLAKRVRHMIDQKRNLLKGDLDALIAGFEERYHFTLAPQQRDAVRSVAGGGVCVITGGPGTGKTTLVRAILHLAMDQKVRFALCSPTGRAAQRLQETTKCEASTIHRLLRMNPQTGAFTHGPESPLPIDLLIVDEASMLDVTLANSLLSAVKPTTTVVFVGDVDQLPSVGPGTVLKDLIDSGIIRTTRLQVVFRQDRQSLIIVNAHRINEGRPLTLSEEKDADFFFIERDEPEKIRETVLTLAKDRIPRRLGCDPVNDVQILAPMRGGSLGTHELNAMLQEELNPKGNKVSEFHNLRIGDKVMQTTNNYDLDVYNGDLGRVTGFDHEQRLVKVRFGSSREAKAYPMEQLNELELAYGITIHKSQGSEYPAVIVVLHTTHYIMLRRNLLYTAVTRGKKLVMVVGSKRALQTAIRTSMEHERQTALGSWLIRPPETGELFR